MMANEQMTQADRDNLRERLGLNDGLMTQYTRFVVNAAQGNFGISYRNGQDVLNLIGERFPATLELVLVATLISLLVGLPLGVLTAIKRGKWYTEGLQFLSIVGVSLPSFVVGILLILVFQCRLDGFRHLGAVMWFSSAGGLQGCCILRAAPLSCCHPLRFRFIK